MDKSKLGITEEGLVYRWFGHNWVLLGRISCLVREETPQGREVRRWWQARLASAEPTEQLVIRGGEEPLFVQAPVHETALVVGSCPDKDLAETALAAD